MWLGKLTALDKTPLGWLGRKTSTQTNIKEKIRIKLKSWNRFIYFYFLELTSYNHRVIYQQSTFLCVCFFFFFFFFFFLVLSSFTCLCIQIYTTERILIKSVIFEFYNQWWQWSKVSVSVSILSFECYMLTQRFPSSFSKLSQNPFTPFTTRHPQQTNCNYYGCYMLVLIRNKNSGPNRKVLCFHLRMQRELHFSSLDSNKLRGHCCWISWLADRMIIQREMFDVTGTDLYR